MTKLTPGTVSKLLKVTKGAVLNYEEMGLVKAERDPDNGYRYFDELALDDLRKVRSFRGMGFSLKETQALVACDSIEAHSRLLAQKEASLREQIQQIEAQIHTVEAMAQNTRIVQEAAPGCRIAESPALLWTPFIGRDCTDAARIEVEAAWAEQMPLVSVSDILHVEADGGLSNRAGFTVPAESPLTAVLPLCDETRLLASQRAVYTVGTYGYSQSAGYPPELYAPLVDFAKEQGLRPLGWILLRGLLTLAKDGDRLFHAELWLPVEP